MAVEFKKTDLKKKKQEQATLESAILSYQDAVKTNDERAVENAYDQIYGIYPAMSYIPYWYKKYNYLYDTQDDFTSDYLRIFCNSLTSWKPKHLRKKSKYNGSGDFKNYFWSSLQNNYINMVKAENSGKRSISLKCPICNEWCTSLSTHLIQKHDDLLWDNIHSMGIDLYLLDKCPFCVSFKFSKRSLELLDRPALVKKLKRHILSMHSNFLFEQFKLEYPEYSNLSSKPASIYVSEEDGGDELSLYDIVQTKDDCLDHLYASGLSEIQEKIIHHIFSENIKNSAVNYDFNVYNCTNEEFETALEDLKVKLFLCGVGSTERE